MSNDKSIVASSSTALAIIDLDPVDERRRRKHKAQVLDEDQYLDRLDKIIQRDFFPDMKKLKAQNEYLDAVQNNDLTKIKMLQERFSLRRTDKRFATPRSPAFFETPQTNQTEEMFGPRTANDTDKHKGVETASDIGASCSDDPPLDKFMYKYTSEDNESFEEILDESDRRVRQAHAWMFVAERDHAVKMRESLALRHADEQRMAIEEADNPATRKNKRASVDNWTYKAVNAVLFHPDSAEYTPEELVARQKMSERQIRHENTRLPSTFTVVGPATTPGCQSQPLTVGGRGADKFSFVVTPSPAPGVSESPMMTWGEIEGTPFRLDASDTVVLRTPGPSFKMPETPLRDKLALSMAADIYKKSKEMKLAAVKNAKLLTPKFGSIRSNERLASMSPAAKRLATSKLGIRLASDKSLKQSYTPSPARAPSGKTSDRKRDKTTPKNIETPNSNNNNESLTDNLLNLPSKKSKPKATDYF